MAEPRCNGGADAKFSGTLRCLIRRWREIERWIETVTGPVRASQHPQLALSELLVERREPVRLDGAIGDWQAITIKFSGDVLPRERDTAFKGAMFAAYPGDLVFSKIDARNGAVGMIPRAISKAVVTSEYPVFIPKIERLRPAFLRHMLRADHFKADLRRMASGTSGRKRVTPEGFLSLEIPVPPLDEQDRLIAAYDEAQCQAARLEQEADVLERDGWRDFETALGITPPPPVPERPLFVARYKDMERWSHESVLRAASESRKPASTNVLVKLGDSLIEIKHGCSKGPSNRSTALKVLKISAVTKGQLILSEHKYISDDESLRRQFSLMAGDILMCRTNGTLAYVGMSALVESDIDDTIFPDKIIRVRPDRTKVVPRFLWRLLQLPAMRQQIEAAARTAVGNFAIGGKDIGKLKVPLPTVGEQMALVDALNSGLETAKAKRDRAAALRQSAWSAFEAALFTPDEAAP